MAGQVHSQHVPAMVGEVAALQAPDAVVVEHAVDHDDGGLGRIERLAAGVAIGLGAVDEDVHHAPAFPAALRARLRASIRSSGSSRPMDRRMVPWLMPAPARASSLMRKWVVEAGWITKLHHSPPLSQPL